MVLTTYLFNFFLSHIIFNIYFCQDFMLWLTLPITIVICHVGEIYREQIVPTVVLEV